MPENDKEKRSSKIDEDKKDGCVIAPKMPLEVVSQFILDQDERETKDIIEYVESQATDEVVRHAELVSQEKVYGTLYAVWDVTTDRNRWWVVTNPTNLYLQEYFPSLDYTLSFHIGLRARVAAKQNHERGSENAEMFEPAWRKWRQAAEAADQADEAEELQAVGMRCREALLAFVKAAASPELIDAGHEAPKAGDFQAWSEILIKKWLPGASMKEFRAFLRSNYKAVWQLVNWLTHSPNANNFIVTVAVGETEGVLTTLNIAYATHDDETPRRCPTCGSYQVISHYEAEKRAYRPVCKACGWEGELYDPASQPASK